MFTVLVVCSASDCYDVHLTLVLLAFVPAQLTRHYLQR